MYKQIYEEEKMKIGIIGAGYVGSATAFSLVMTGVAHKVVLVDCNQEKSSAEAEDISHATPFTSAAKVISGDYSDLSDSDIVIVTAGANQKPDESRIDLLARNVKIFEQIIPQIAKHSPKCILIIATNPVDVMTEVALKLSGFSKERVIGSGTVLDTARFRTLLGQKLKISTKSVHADVLGEHGDSEVLIWSSAEAGTLSLDEYALSCNQNLDILEKDSIVDGVVNAAYKIIAGKGYTNYGIAGAITHICRAISNNEHAILTVSSHHDEFLTVKDVCLSLPSVIDKCGISHVIKPKLSEEEFTDLKASALTIKQNIDKALNIIS